MVDAQSSLLSLPSFYGLVGSLFAVVLLLLLQSAIEPFCSAFHFLYVLFFLLQPFCQYTYLDRH